MVRGGRGGEGAMVRGGEEVRGRWCICEGWVGRGYPVATDERSATILHQAFIGIPASSLQLVISSPFAQWPRGRQHPRSYRAPANQSQRRAGIRSCTGIRSFRLSNCRRGSSLASAYRKRDTPRKAFGREERRKEGCPRDASDSGDRKSGGIRWTSCHPKQRTGCRGRET